ncbi:MULTISPECIES: LacI family DNA-binding transcriptional regulator [Thermaerobacter]|uniref:Substrate-binding domain-containing protein n=1 Tax=Thermaerobacter composti TaxID=554949 RepID=A0ABZ0QKX7_9FIRM|nr:MULTISPECIES: substrate-binding domain-containing protein [Thermaerobacter]PZN09080.1 MAG: LacI family transcriptional regulator [Bacillota bacterium]QBS38120.1 LacI family transcriptional regulator [Thermaerobacter sp. FW80]WPD18150.1 substrate-binding domain-containing protein [Thermaerobacter composti]
MRSAAAAAGTAVHLVTPCLAGEEEGLPEALVAALARQGWRVAVWPVADDAAQQLACLRALPMDEPVLLVPARDAGPDLAAAVAQRVAVAAGRPLPGSRLDTWLVENYRAGYLAGKHLVNLRHQEVAYLGPAGASPAAAERLRGFRQALRHNGRELPAQRVAEVLPDADAVAAALRRWWSDEPAPTALFAASPQLAAWALAALEEMGRRVPDDVALVGYGDGPLARALRPRLTAVVPPLDELARQAAATLAERARSAQRAGERRAEPVRLAPRLIIRQSCGMRAAG